MFLLFRLLVCLIRLIILTVPLMVLLFSSCNVSSVHYYSNNSSYVSSFSSSNGSHSSYYSSHVSSPVSFSSSSNVSYSPYYSSSSSSYPSYVYSFRLLVFLSCNLIPRIVHRMFLLFVF